MPTVQQQDIAMNDKYRSVWQANLAAAMKHRGETPQSLAAKAWYIDGPNKGSEHVGMRSIRYNTEGTDGSSPSLDMVAALATALNFSVFQLLIPGFDPESPPVVGTHQDIENETNRRLEVRWSRQQDQVQNLLVALDERKNESPVLDADSTGQDARRTAPAAIKHKGKRPDGKRKGKAKT